VAIDEKEHKIKVLGHKSSKFWDYFCTLKGLVNKYFQGKYKQDPDPSMARGAVRACGPSLGSKIKFQALNVQNSRLFLPRYNVSDEIEGKYRKDPGEANRPI